MTPDLFVANVIAHATQAAIVTAAAALIHIALRRAHPGLRLALWQTVLALNVLAPVLQPWRPVPVAATATIGAFVVSSNTAGALAPGRYAVSVSSLLLAAIAVGIAARLAWLAIGLIKLRSLARSSDAISEQPDPVRRAIEDVGVSAEFRISGEAGPVSFGTRQPIVVVPRQFLSLDAESQYLIAAHELEHVCRRDFVQVLAEEVGTALLWYQPWTWLIRAQVKLAREQVVDRHVSGRALREAYVHTLLSMAGHQVPALSSGAGFLQVSELFKRIEALYKEVPMSRLRIAFTAALSAAGVVALAVVVAAAFPLRTTTSDQSHASAVSAVSQSVQDDQTVRVGGDIKPPRKIKDVRPVYPKEAKDAGIQGVVILEVVIDPAGRVSRVDVARSIPELDQAAVDAVQEWEFEPTYVKGKAVSVEMTVTVNFTLE